MLNVVVVVSPQLLAAARPGCALQRLPYLVLVLLLSMHALITVTQCLFLRVDGAIVKMISNIPVLSITLLPIPPCK